MGWVGNEKKKPLGVLPPSGLRLRDTLSLCRIVWPADSSLHDSSFVAIVWLNSNLWMNRQFAGPPILLDHDCHRRFHIEVDDAILNLESTEDVAPTVGHHHKVASRVASQAREHGTAIRSVDAGCSRNPEVFLKRKRRCNVCGRNPGELQKQNCCNYCEYYCQ